MIPAGHRNQLISIQAPPTGRNSLGQRTGAWTNFATAVWARVRPVRGREVVAAGTVLPEGAVVFGMNYLAGVLPSMRVMWNDTPHAIVAPPVDPDGMRHTLELYCVASTKDAA
jgi:SPP1 family predicted phage head-tail adaptor